MKEKEWRIEVMRGSCRRRTLILKRLLASAGDVDEGEEELMSDRPKEQVGIGMERSKKSERREEVRTDAQQDWPALTCCSTAAIRASSS